MLNTTTVEPWTIIDDKQTEYWDQYMTESGTADALFALGHTDAACCANSRALQHLNRYVAAGEIKQLFANKFYN